MPHHVDGRNPPDLIRGPAMTEEKAPSEMFALDESGLEAMLANGTIGEVDCDG